MIINVQVIVGKLHKKYDSKPNLGRGVQIQGVRSSEKINIVNCILTFVDLRYISCLCHPSRALNSEVCSKCPDNLCIPRLGFLNFQHSLQNKLLMSCVPP